MLKFVGYIILKWVCIYTFEYFDSSIKWNQEINHEGWLLAAFMLLAMPLLEIILLTIPFHWALKHKGGILIAILLSTFALEFAIGYYMTTQRFATWIIIKLFFSVALFYLFYKKQIKINY